MDLNTDSVRISHELRICQNLCLHTTILQGISNILGFPNKLPLITDRSNCICNFIKPIYRCGYLERLGYVAAFLSGPTSTKGYACLSLTN